MSESFATDKQQLLKEPNTDSRFAEALYAAKVVRNIGATLVEVKPYQILTGVLSDNAEGYILKYEDGDTCDFNKDLKYKT